MEVTVNNITTTVEIEAGYDLFEVVISDLSDENIEKYAIQAAQSAADALESANLAEADKIQTGLDRAATGSDRVQTGFDKNQTGLDRIATGQDKLATAADRVQTGLDRIQTGLDTQATEADKVQTGLDRIATSEDRTQTGLDRIATGADRVQTGLDATATAADRVQTGLDRVATGADRTQTGLDRLATGADRAQTGLDRIATGQDKLATAADRVQTGLDRIQTGLDATATEADKVIVETKAAEVSADRVLAETAKDLAEAFALDSEASKVIAVSNATTAVDAKNQAVNAANNAVFVVTGGTASLLPSPGKIPIANSLGKIDAGWIDPIARIDSAALHRSPNAVTSLFIYDTSKDSDGGAWTEKCQNTSWYNETLAGKWLGQFATEALARAVAGATTNDYFQLTTTGRFFRLNATSGTTEIFRGNKALFPKVSAILSEAGIITIYDLTENGNPMWMVFRFGGASWNNANLFWPTTFAASSIKALNGLIVGGATFPTDAGVTVVDFPKDSASKRTALTSYGGMYRGTISLRNSAKGYNDNQPTGMSTIINGVVRDVAMCILPNAPIDPVTNLKIPTIGLATNGGVSVIRSDGSVANTLLYNNANIGIDRVGNFVTIGENTRNYRKTLAPNYTTTLTYVGGPLSFNGSIAIISDLIVNEAGKLTSALVKQNRLAFGFLKENDPRPSASLFAEIGSTYNTGYLVGDIRRAYLADSVVGNVSNPATILDRSFRSRTITTFGTILRSIVNTGTDLVGYSGFSNVNYFQEPYSAELDFGIGEFTISSWVKNLKGPRRNFLLYTEQFDNASWTKTRSTITPNIISSPFGDNTADLLSQNSGETSRGFVSQLVNATVNQYTYSVFAKKFTKNFIVLTDNTRGGTGYINSWFNLDTGTVGTVGPERIGSIENFGNGWYRCSITVTSVLNLGLDFLYGLADTNNSTTVIDSGGIYIWGAQVEVQSATDYQRVLDSSQLFNSMIVSRSFLSGPYINLSLINLGNLRAELFDGTTTRTVTTTNTYNINEWIRVRVNYLAGRLSIMVNGVEMAVTVGNPLLTLNNASAVLTIGNSFELNAPFPGSLALLKISATVPTPEQSVWIYEQEKQMFRVNAKCILPDIGVINDLTYDESTDTWISISAANESNWTGLVRTSVKTPSAGSFSRVDAKSGYELVARTGTNIGVDVSIPSLGLRNEVNKRAESAARLSQDLSVFDYNGGFTANTVLGNVAITNVLLLSYPTSYIGARVSGAGIPANTTVVAVSGNIIYLSAAATATATAVQISFLDFNLPSGFDSTAVLIAGTLRQEGSTKDYSKLFDGFKQTIRLGTAPAHTAWVQISSKKEIL